MSSFKDLIEFRTQLYTRYLDRKISLLDFVHGSFNYLKQQKLRPHVKVREKSEILFNYYYWQIHIERKVIVERQLLDQGLGSQEKLDEVTLMYLKRRDQMVRRLLFELEEPIKDLYLIFGDTVEIILNDGTNLYSSLESLKKVKIEVQKVQKSAFPQYLPAIKLK